MQDFLKPGDTIGVAAPSGRFDREKLEQGVKNIKAMGFRVKLHDGIFGASRYLAGSDEQRARVLMDLFRDSEVRAVIAARGGYGAMRLLPFLDWQALRSFPKLFIGFSDATALMSCLVSRAGMKPVHGPNLVSLAGAGRETLAGVERAITGAGNRLSLADGACLVPGTARGRLAGGNLATLVHMMGTRFQPDFTHTILFLEDVGEPAYKIDRMLTQMRLAGLFDRIRGVVLGEFTNCANTEYLPEIFMETFGPLKIPVITGLQAGHGEVNQAFPLGRETVLDTAAAELSWKND